jgi:hypothetical protein
MPQVAFELLVLKLYLKRRGVFATTETDFLLLPAIVPGGSNGEEVPRSFANPEFLAVDCQVTVVPDMKQKRSFPLAFGMLGV